MQYITEQDLLDLGIEKSGEELAKLLEFANGELQERVGLDVVDALTDDELVEYIELKENGNEEEISKWLGEKIPDLEDIVAAEVTVILGDLAENADKM